MTQPFYFPDGRLANNADDLFELCQQYPDDATNYLVGGDLENWLAYIGSYDLAECATNVRQSELEDRQKLEEFINRFSSITSAQAVPAAVTQTQINNDSAVVEPTQTTESSDEESTDTSVAATLPMAATVTDTTEVPPQEETSTAPTTATPPAVTAESLRSSSAEDSQPQSAPSTEADSPKDSQPQSAPSTEADSPKEKPSFFQVVAKFIVKIIYRNKA